jgi:Protein of unknown function (DUF2695)
VCVLVPEWREGWARWLIRRLIACERRNIGVGQCAECSLRLSYFGVCHAAAMDEDRNGELKRAFKNEEQTKAQGALLLDEDQLTELLNFLDERLLEVGCDHSARLTRTWATESGVDPDALASSFEQFGGLASRGLPVPQVPARGAIEPVSAVLAIANLAELPRT